MIHLFGIKYADEINRGGHSKKDIANSVNILESYGTEISKEVKLSKHVLPK